MFCRHLVDLARIAGWQVRGILCPAVFANGQKVAIEAEALPSGSRRQLATRRLAGQPQTGPATRRWQFDPEVVAWGNRILQQAPPCDLLVIDELGPLELERGEGWAAGLTALEGGDYRGAVVVIRPELLAAARHRWPTACVITIEQVSNSRPAAQKLAARLFGAGQESSSAPAR